MTYTLVQDSTSTDNFSSGTVAITPLTGVTAGHGLTLLLDVNLAVELTSITSDNSDVWQRLVAAINAPAGFNPLVSEIWYCKSSAGGSPTLTLTAAGDSGVTKWDVTEWDGPFTAAGDIASGNDLTTDWALDPVTAGTGDLTLFTLADNDGAGATGAPPSGFTGLAASTGDFSAYMAFGYLADAATTTGSGVVGGTNGWSAVIGVLTSTSPSSFTGAVGTATAAGIPGSFSGSLSGGFTGAAGTATAAGIVGSFTGSGGSAGPVAETTIRSISINYASNFTAPGTAAAIGTYPVPADAALIVLAGGNDPSVTDLAVSDTAGHTWTPLVPYDPDTMPLVVDMWRNDTGATQLIEIQFTATYINNKIVGIGVYLIANCGATPIVQATLTGATTIPELSGTPAEVGSLFCLHYVQQTPSAVVSGFDAGTTGDSTAGGYAMAGSGSDAMGVGTLYQTAVNNQTFSPVTVGATAPDAATYAVLVEYVPAVASTGNGFLGIRGPAAAVGIPGRFTGTDFHGGIARAATTGIPGTVEGTTIITGPAGTATAAGIPGAFSGTMFQSGDFPGSHGTAAAAGILGGFSGGQSFTGATGSVTAHGIPGAFSNTAAPLRNITITIGPITGGWFTDTADGGWAGDLPNGGWAGDAPGGGWADTGITA